MARYIVRAVTTEYWRPGTDYLQEIISSIKGKVADGDFVVVSEKAISTAINNIVDENSIKPSAGSEFIARYWMRIVWGYFLGRMCHFHEDLIESLREYPLEKGSAHKQLALRQSGLLQALMFGSEGGIDASNLPYAYVSLPLKAADKIASRIHKQIIQSLQRQICVVIADTDSTYFCRNLRFTPRPKPIKGIHSSGGIIAYVLGRVLSSRRNATPIAVAGRSISVELALKIAETANRARGFGAGRTVWDMAARFKVGLDEVSWEMLDTVKHKPIVIVRAKR